MCLFVKSGPHVATKNISVLKIIYDDDQSEYKRFQYTPFSKYSLTGNPFAGLRLSSMSAIDVGFHAYRPEAITGVEPRGQKGLQEVFFGTGGDLAVDGQKIDDDNDFTSLIRAKGVGDTIVLKVLSKGVEKFVTLRLEQAPENM